MSLGRCIMPARNKRIRGGAGESITFTFFDIIYGERARARIVKSSATTILFDRFGDDESFRQLIAHGGVLLSYLIGRQAAARVATVFRNIFR